MTHIINGVKIHVSQQYDLTYQAITDNYDCDCDQDGYFSTHPTGWGKTEQEAINDLLEQLEDA
jgi:hypothetical protein